MSWKFDDFFVNMGPNLANNIPHQNQFPLDFIGRPSVNSIFLSQVTSLKIFNVLTSLKTGAAGHDEISAALLTLTWSSIVPNELKVASVIPLYKADDPLLFNDYRPVYMLKVISKVFEKAMYIRLKEYLDKFKIFVSNQFGFKKLHSSYMVLINGQIDHLVREKQYVITIFCLTFQKSLTLLINLYCFINSPIMLSEVMPWVGLKVTYQDAPSM